MEILIWSSTFLNHQSEKLLSKAVTKISNKAECKDMRWSVCLFIFNLAKSDIDHYSTTVSHKMPRNSLSEISKDLLEMQKDRKTYV